MSTQMNYSLNAELLGGIIQYLDTRPYREVGVLMNSLLATIGEQNKAAEEAANAPKEKEPVNDSAE